MKKILSLIFLLTTFYLLLTANVAPALAAGECPGSTCPACITCLGAGNTISECSSCGAGVHSGAAWFVQDTATWQQQTFADNPELMTAQRYGVFMVTNLAQTVITALGGVQTHTDVMTDSGIKTVTSRTGGAISLLAGLTGSLYTTPPASSVEYLADLGNNLGITKPTYAQGIGFNAFSPVLKIWKVFRDLAYLGFVIIFVVIGFMVMFRKKIDPRTVVTIQESLPRIILALILVTFSYAIAGLIIDLGELSTRLIAGLLYNGQLLGVNASGAGGTLDSFREKLLQSNIFELVNPLRQVGDLTQTIGQIKAVPTQISIGPINLAEVTVSVAFWLAGFFIMFKIFFALLGPYVSIILSIIFAPIQLLFMAIPGENNSLMGWLKGLLADVMVFPVTFGMLAIAAFLKAGTYMAQCPPDPSKFMGAAAPWCTSSTPVTSFWAPATIGNWGLAIGELAGWGILFTIPKVVEIVHESLHHKPGVATGAAGEETMKALGRVPLVGGMLTTPFK